VVDLVVAILLAFLVQLTMECLGYYYTQNRSSVVYTVRGCHSLSFSWRLNLTFFTFENL
jgi:hypothetical protein